MDNIQLEQHIDDIQNDLLSKICMNEIMVNESRLAVERQISDVAATCVRTVDIRDWMHRFEECMGNSLRHFSMAVMEQIEQKMGVPFFGAEKLSEDIESLFLEQMK